MYRLPAIAVLLAATALQPSLEGQMRSARPNIPVRSRVAGFHVVQSPGRSLRMVSPPFRPFGGGRHVFIRPAFRHGFRADIFFGNSCFRSTFFDPFFCQQFFFPNRFVFAQPVYIPYPIYSAPSYQVADSTSTAANEYADLRGELGQLTSEVEQLRQEQALREQARLASPPPSPVVENTPTILVFRDGHRSEIRNYAIVGKTLWVFTEQRARKISVSDLDIDATRRVNAGHGVEVPFP
jgi:hypothetical protein